MNKFKEKLLIKCYYVRPNLVPKQVKKKTTKDHMFLEKNFVFKTRDVILKKYILNQLNYQINSFSYIDPKEDPTDTKDVVIY